MRICIVTSSFPKSDDDPTAAAGNFVKDFALSVAERGHDVTVLTQDRGAKENFTLTGIELEFYPWQRKIDRPLSQLRPYRPRDLHSMVSILREGSRRLTQLHRKEPFDHLMGMWAIPAGWICQRLKRYEGVPYSIWCLGSDIWTYGRIPMVRNRVGHILSDSHRCYADGCQLANDAHRLSGRDVEVLYSSRRLDVGKKTAIEVKGSPPRFLFVGRYVHVKGVDILLEAMSHFVKSQRKGFLHLFGGGPLAEMLRRRASESDLADYVEFGNYASEGTVVSYLSVCDAVVIPSRVESVPVALSDALQMRKPVIVTDVGDMGSLIRESGAGLVVPPDDPHALCVAMQEMARKQPDNFREALNALANRFSIGQSADRWLSQIDG